MKEMMSETIVKKGGFCICLFLILVVWSVAQDASGESKNIKMLHKLRLAQPMLDKGFNLLTSRNLEGAGHEFDRCLEVLPENPSACFGKACIANESGDIPGALMWMEKAEKASLCLQQLWKEEKTNLLKSSQEERERLRELAVGLQHKAEKASCNASEYLAESANARREAGESSFKESSDDSPFTIPAEHLSLHGNLLFKLKRLDEAEVKYLAALAIAPTHERCLNNLINIYYVTGRIEAARLWLDKAVELKVKINPGLIDAVRRANAGSTPEKSG